MTEHSLAPEPEIQFHSLAHQGETAELGIWVFLATEVLFFGGMFLAYALYRSTYPIAFALASKDTKFIIGTANTVLLLTSSVTMAWAVSLAGTPARRILATLLCVTAALGAVFIALKGYEYYLDFSEHNVPGLDFAMNRPLAAQMELFWFLYYMMTGIHAVHLTIGIAIVATMAVRAARDSYRSYGKPVEIAGYYWSFVDLVWLFLYAMIYLGGRNLS
jgi:cytochrome c oxidase subunit III